MVKKTKKKSTLNVYSNLTRKRRTKKDRSARKHAEYLATLPKHPIKRFFYRLHPKRVAKFWFSKRGGLMALKITGVLVLVGVLSVGAVFAYYRKDLDAIRPGNIADRVQTTVTVYKDRNDKVLWEDKGGEDYRLAVESDQISDYMKEATIALEDRDFYEHDGISIFGIARSAINNARGGDVQGGSTLTQQLVKQVFLAEEANKRGLDGIPRKIKEVILAIEVERMYDKEQILNLYLNESSYGGRRNGVESAAQTYFNKSAKDLNLPESALIASIPNLPSLYNPYYTPGNKSLIARQHKALDAMTAEGYITQKEADAAKKVPIIDKVKPEQDQYKNIKAPHFVLMVKQELEKELGPAIVGRGGLTVKTSLDIRIQKKLEESMNTMFTSHWPSYAGFTNGAATVEDVATGQIIAMMGSRDFNYAGFGQDNAAAAYIQPGSTIKPLVYAELFKNKGSNAQNFGSGSILADDKGADKIYGAPLRNADGRYLGSIDIRKALALSRNIPAVKAMYVSGVEPTIGTIRALGNKGYCTQGQEVQAGLSAAIGGCGSKQIDLVNSFASLARMGTYIPHSSILEVQNSKGETLKKYKPSKKSVIDPQVAYILADILSDDQARAGLYGMNKYGLVVPGVRTAAKTGTSDKDGKPKDIWTLSYSPAIAMGVWLGNPDTRVLTNGNSSIPTQIIGDVMSYAHTEVYAKENKWKPGDWFKRPSGVQTIKGELYPSWYNKKNAQKSTKLTFDRLSKKRSTDCTPSGARIEIAVTELIDPVSKKKVYIAPDGYNAKEKDDVHKCNDAKPSVSVSTTDGESISVSYRRGKFPITSITVYVDGKKIANISARNSGSKTISSGMSSGESFSIKATINDEGYYSDSGSSRYSAPEDTGSGTDG